MTNSLFTDHLKASGKSTGTFYFKQFSVADGLSTMKVGTDAVLLGAAVELEGVESILEIGTGCGVIALMLAQRSKAMIEAIEIDVDSVNQAKHNVSQSLWEDRISVINSSLQDYGRIVKRRYDLIVSNPPYFSRSLKSPSERKNISRHNDSLSFKDLVQCASELMQPEASLWVILPVKESAEFLEAAKKQGLLIHLLIKVYPKSGGCHYRNIIRLKKFPLEDHIVDNLFIKDEFGCYTKEYKQLTKDFYLDL
jgi:tRNA1Val (adenine37-N6)-methyltransferase